MIAELAQVQKLLVLLLLSSNLFTLDIVATLRPHPTPLAAVCMTEISYSEMRELD